MNILTGMPSRRLSNSRHEYKNGSRDTNLMTMNNSTGKKTQAKGLATYGSGGDCAVERVFSRLKKMRDICGDNSLEDMTEVRIFMMCNGDLDELLYSLV
eukprot:scaffold3881_cov173-Chaetoceros_neogracile.AAC.2